MSTQTTQTTTRPGPPGRVGQPVAVDAEQVDRLAADALAAAGDLGKRIGSLRRLAPARRAAAARPMVNEAKQVLSMLADAAVFEATRAPGATWRSVGAELGVSESTVNKAVTRHLARLAAHQADRLAGLTSTVWCDNPAHHTGRGMAGSWTEHHATEDCVDPHFTGQHAPRTDQADGVAG